MAEKRITFAGNWTGFMRRGGLALAALGILMFVIKINTVIAFYFIFGGAASWVAGKALKARS